MRQIHILITLRFLVRGDTLPYFQGDMITAWLAKVWSWLACGRGLKGPSCSAVAELACAEQSLPGDNRAVLLASRTILCARYES